MSQNATNWLVEPFGGIFMASSMCIHNTIPINTALHLVSVALKWSDNPAWHACEDHVYTKHMASLQKHRVGGRTYWRIVESRRVNGKPRAVPILYLGSADELLNGLLEAPSGELRIRSFQHGDVAALKAAADRLGVVSIIDRHVGRRARKLSVGTTLLLAALNRAIRPRSKRAWAAWACQTSLARLFPKLKPETLTSQFFWDQMDCVQVEALQAIEDDLTKVVVEHSGVQLDTLFYDATNFFTYIASTTTILDFSRIARRLPFFAPFEGLEAISRVDLA